MKILKSNKGSGVSILYGRSDRLGEGFKENMGILREKNFWRKEWRVFYFYYRVYR